MDRWRGKAAIVTGASAGIGEAIARQLVEAGVNVAGFARRVERVEELSKKLGDKSGAKLYAVKCDVTNEGDILSGFKWVKNNLGPVHILVNNAGVLRSTTLIDGSTEEWKKILDTNILGLCVCTREAVKSMQENKIDGHIVHISSITAHYVPQFPHFNVYPASKHAVRALTETLRQELNFKDSKIKITSVSPGFSKTEIFDVGGIVNHENSKILLESIPKLTSEEVADAVLYVVGTSPNVQITELTIRPVGEKL